MLIFFSTVKIFTNNKLRVVTSGHVTKMAVTPCYAQTWWPYLSIYSYRIGVIGDRSLGLYCGNRHFGRFWLLWPWPWPDDFLIQIWPVLPGDIPDAKIRTSYVKAFESYRLSDIQTDRIDRIINHAVSLVVIVTIMIVLITVILIITTIYVNQRHP